jgi:MoaA/NifB/PqqE/SkfB family radical SAM enzyme
VANLSAPRLRYLDFPRHIQLQTHTACNMSCTICPHPELELNKVRHRLSWEQFTRIIDECAAAPEFADLVLDLQNEPLLDVDLERRIAYVKAVRPDVFVGITTNGRRLGPERAATLLDSGIDQIVVSLNASSSQTFAAIESRAPFGEILRNVNSLLGMVNRLDQIVVSFGVWKANLSELKGFVTSMEAKSIPYRVFPLHDRVRAIHDDRLLDIDSTPTCHLPLFSTAIHANGDLILCCQDWVRSKVVGNVLEEGIRGVWNSAEYREIREASIDGSGLPSTPCGSCKGRVIYSADRILPRELARIRANLAPDSHEPELRASAPRYPRFQLVPRGAGLVLHDFVARDEIPITSDEAWLFERLQAGEPEHELVERFATFIGASRAIAADRLTNALTSEVILEVRSAVSGWPDILELPKRIWLRNLNRTVGAMLESIQTEPSTLVIRPDSAPDSTQAWTAVIPCVLDTLEVELPLTIVSERRGAIVCAVGNEGMQVLQAALRSEVIGNPIAGDLLAAP